jgi:hypothetical protein
MTGVIGGKVMARGFPLIHRELWEGRMHIIVLILIISATYNFIFTTEVYYYFCTLQIYFQYSDLQSYVFNVFIVALEQIQLRSFHSSGLSSLDGKRTSGNKPLI